MTFEPRSFDRIDQVLASFESTSFKKLNRFERHCKVNETLYDLIVKHKKRGFVFAEVVDFITRVIEQDIFERYSFSEFETWLIQFSNLEEEKQIEARALIVGKNLPRDEYQSYFPVGMGKQYEGPHFVTAHVSPDVDTLVGSFWGFMDAFAARVATGVHIWNVPGGKPRGVEAQLLFCDTFGEKIFEAVAKQRTSLTVTSYELMTQTGLIKRGLNDFMLSIDHERNHYAVILVDDKGSYLGDWRHFDVEGVRQVIMSFNALVRWLERKLHNRLIALFAKNTLTKGEYADIVQTTFSDQLRDLHSIKEYTDKQVEHLDLFLKQVFRIEKGIESNVGEFALQLGKEGIVDFSAFKGELKALETSPLFDKQGKLVENRPLLFTHFEKIFQILSQTSRALRTNIERFKVALDIKTHVFGYTPQYLSHRTEVQEIKSKMGSYPSLTVTLSEKDGGCYPMGIIHAKDLQRGVLGTVTLRDFSNREETKVPDYLEVISIIDHHKTNMITGTPPMVLICDAQSSNTLVARLALNTYSRFSSAGMNPSSIDKQIAETKPLTTKNMRFLSRLYKRKTALETTADTPYYVHPEREKLEYLHYIHAILDDTDLLTKVSKRDVDVMRDLLNRLESIKQKKVCEVVDFDDIACDNSYVKNAARRLLENNKLYAMYKRIYDAKEKVIDEDLICCSKDEPSSIFDDVKIQNGCARIGQTKFFSKNYPLFAKLVQDLRHSWLSAARRYHKTNPDINLHMHMCSTVASADELHKGTTVTYQHKDEMWFWIPFTDLSIEHLKLFLNGFKNSPKVANNHFELTVLGPQAQELLTIFKESFLPIPLRIEKCKYNKETVAVLTYTPATLNSRKAMISPYLPKKMN